jgi:MtrB/PioB family decaheme-associated outer membrane protein
MARLSMAALPLVAAPGAHADPPDTSAWKCERCPFAAGYRAQLTAGASYVTDDSTVIGDATGYDEQGAYPNFDGEGLYASGAHRVSWRAEDLGLDSRIVEAQAARPGKFELGLAYQQLPRHRFDDARTIFTRGSGNLLALPPAWTNAGTTAGFTDLAASLAPIDIESERRTLELGGTYLPARRFRLFADFERQERDGSRLQGAPYFTSASLLPAPFDYQTDQVDAGIRYDVDRGYLKLAYHASFFDSHFDTVRWESPFTTVPGAEQSALAEAPDNDLQQLMVSGGYRAALLDTRVSFSAAVGRGTQDEALLPYTTNTNLVTAPLPASSLDAEVDTTNLALTVVTRPLPKLRVKAGLRRDERDNDTRALPWTRVIADTFVSGETELNVPYGFERLRLNLRGDYDWSNTIRASAGYDYTEYDRDFQEVAEQTEDTGWGRLEWRPNGRLQIAARGGVSRREIDRYDEALAASFGQNPLLRKFNLAYRYRKFGELSASVTAADGAVTVGVQASYADDSYSSTLVGLTDSEELRLAADLTWTLSEKASVYLSGGFDAIDARQTGSAAFAAPDWRALQSDEFTSLGGGMRIRGIGEKLDLQLDYWRAEGVVDLDVAGGIGPSRFPDLESTLDSVRARMTYHWSEKFETSVQIRYERLPTEDWALEGVGPDTLATILTLGAQPYDDETLIAGLGFRYRVGSP